MIFTSQSKNKFYFMVVVLLFAFLASPDATAQRKKRNKKNKGDTEQVAPSKKKSTQKSIEDLTKKSKKIDGLFTMYQDTITGSLHMLVSKAQLEKEFIYFSQISDGVSDAGPTRGDYNNSKIFTVKKYFNKIEFIYKNHSFYFDPESPLAKSANANISEGVMASIKIDAFDEEKGLYLIKVDDLFLKETFTQIKYPRYPGQSPFSFTLGTLNKGKTKIKKINNYPENTDLVIDYVYSKTSTFNGGSEAVTDGRNVTIRVHHSLIEVPKNTYTPRYDDPRVGYFITQVNDMTSDSQTPYRDLVHRWHLEKKDPNAVISEPVTPIVWWIENTTPLEVREIVKEGVLKWNLAFEKAGFKNAIVVKIQPKDADWDAGDIRYNVLRWASSPDPSFSGYGPSFVNPKTGQILGADIMLEYSAISSLTFIDKLYVTSNAKKETYFEDEEDHLTQENHLKYCSLGNLMHENNMFGNTALKLHNASPEATENMKRESLLSLVMHEVGHTLGLNHNMKSSQLFSPAQLANKNFIQGKALTGSIMDYETINLTNDPLNQGHYYSPTIGAYDFWAIEFGYKPVKTYKELDDILKRSTEPELIFGNDADDMRSPGKAIDPRVMTGDLSNDQITYSVDRINLINSMLRDIKPKFSTDNKSYQEMRNAFYSLYYQKISAANVISRFIGGVYVDRAMHGQVGATQPFTPVSYADQKRAMKALEDYIFSPNTHKDIPQEVYTHMARQRRGFNFFNGPEDPKIHSLIIYNQARVLQHILHYRTLQRIVDSELYGNEYKIQEYMSDLNKAIFNKDINTSVNSVRQNLQIEYTNMLIEMLTGKSSRRFNNIAKSMAVYNLKNIRKYAANGLGDLATKAHKTHLKTLIDNAMKEIK
ncbi:zinc-dependent metalloprotease [Kordia jejudonensis]|uniref:zinc-dependent metalloprotease n=1 Tax=Kordia jejudonensis TaxID=1348245 RepID=UPI00062978B1|nr:zinc-dependent metalloprotease [Kordia jejudonensis]